MGAYPIVMQIARRTLSTARASLDELRVIVVPSPLARQTGRRWLMSLSLAPMKRELISNLGKARPVRLRVSYQFKVFGNSILPMTSASTQGIS